MVLLEIIGAVVVLSLIALGVKAYLAESQPTKGGKK
jgi:hypothetical protein